MEGKKTGGRKSGTPNKVTKITRELIADLAAGMVDDVKANIKMLAPKDMIYVWIKLVEFNVPKPTSISIDVERGVQKTIEDELRKLSGGDEESV
jgi:hypothetical protein